MKTFFGKIVLLLTGIVCIITEDNETYLTHISWLEYFKITLIKMLDKSYDCHVQPLMPWEWRVIKIE